MNRHYGGWRLGHEALLFVCLALCAMGGLRSTAAAEAGTPVQTVVERAEKFLQKEAYAWKGTRQCAACHHAALVVWSFNEAKAHGYPVDEAGLKELTEWAFNNTKENIAVDQAPPRDVINLGAAYTLMSVESAPRAAAPDDPVNASGPALVSHIVGKLKEDGSWGVPMDLRVPLGGPPEDIAILSRIALLQSGDRSTTVTETLKRAADWLAANHDAESRQARNLRVFMDLQEGASAEKIERAVADIRLEQNADGGWSQTPDMASDAYGTGQTLFILSRAGVKPDDPQIARGVEFLIRTQAEDGSWPMTSRVNSKNMSPIMETGAAWAVLGIVRAAPQSH